MAPLRMSITWDALEMAKDAGDTFVISACRRIIDANRIGWRKHGQKSDLNIVIAFYDGART